MTNRPLRLFVAATPPRKHLEWVQARLAEVENRWPGARWTPTDNQHVTLRFLGATDPVLLPDVIEACRGAAGAIAPARIGLGGFGAFPSARRARVLWLGLVDPTGALTALADALGSALDPLGFAPERRSFSPHLTVARFRAPENLGPLPDLPEETPAPFDLTDFVLWRSHLSPRGARYEAVERFSLPSDAE